MQRRVKVRHVSKTLSDLTANNCLESLKEKYVLVPIDKAANNVAFVCKRYYAEVLFKEMGFSGTPNSTYTIYNNKNIQNFIKVKEKEIKTKFKKSISSEMKKLPTAYWTPKMHKTPVGARFIIASKECVTKELSKDIASIFRLFMLQVRKYHEKSQYFSGVKSFWVIDNNIDVIHSLKSLSKKNRAKQVSTFDFSTLYTKIPHKKLLEVLTDIIEFCFKGRTKDSIKLDFYGNAYCCKKHNFKGKKIF